MTCFINSVDIHTSLESVVAVRGARTENEKCSIQPDRARRSDQEEEKQKADVCLTLVCKSILFILIIYPTLFCPNPYPPPSPTTSGIPMSPVTVTVTIANQSSPAERRQPNKEEQKKGLLSVCFFLVK